MANTSTSGLLTDAQLAGSASLDGALFIPAITTIATRLMVHDPRYVQCVMNSGLFQFAGDFDVFAAFRGGDASGNGSDSGGRGRQESASFAAAATLLGVDPSVQLGSCRLACGGSPNYISQSQCCAAAARFRDTCKLSPSAQAYHNYTVTLNTMLGLKSDCAAVTAPTVSLWVVASLLVLALTVLVVLTRRLLQSHRRQQSPDDANEMERASASGVALAPTPTTSHSRYEKLLLSWQQVANLVWKNVRIKRATPVAFAMEIFLPLILTSGLVVIANIDDIIWGTGPWPDDGTVERATAQITTPASGFFCTNFNADTGDTLGVPSGTKRTFYANGQTVVGLFLLIVYIKFVSRTTAMMVMEKEARLREIMKIMGLSDRAVIISWLLTTAVTATPLSFAMAALLKYTKVFPHGSYIVLVWLFFLLSMAITAFAYFLTPLFRKSRTASIASVLAWIVLYFPYFGVQAKGNAVKYAAALAPPTALGLAIDALLRHAQLGTGMAYDMAIARRPVTVPTPLAMCGMLVVDIVLLLLLGWYLDQIVPQEHGVPRKWNFLFTKAYWVGKRSAQASSDYADLSTPTAAAQDRPMERPADCNGPVIEPVTAALAAQERNGTCLQIRDLSKVFHTEDTDRVAVDSLSLTMYSGQITALLGHNGAGKTTTIAMLTGLTPPTSGDAVLFGRSIRTDFDELRQIMGICPQHDVLLGELSVQDHLRFFGIMKHVPPHLLEDEVEKMIQEVGLTEKRKVASKNLSGGQKRKLSVALAFIGGSKLVFLDEPTSGMDPYSRRFTWNLLQRNREDRVTVLTTHFMDEADILGDRIAILADGQLRCAGSSLFLKNRFGAGYNLTVIKANAACAVQPVAALLQQFVATATCLSHHGAEMVFQLPADTVESFPRMLEALDAEMKNLQIAQYGVSVTTLEEVFLRISRDRDDERKPLRTASSKQFAPASSYECGNASLTSQISAMVTKRFRITRRDRKSLLNAIAIPVLLLVIATVIPEIQVSSFLTDFANAAPSKTMESSCSIQPSALDVPPFVCTRRYDYCHMGIFRCDPQTCCTASNHASPYFPCNNCKTPNRACYNPTCLSPMGAKAQVTVNSFLKATIVALAFAFVPAAIVAFIVREKNEIQNAKILQLICGAKPAAYWVANWIHDSLLLLVPLGVAAIMVLTTSRGISSPTTNEVFALLILLVAHALAVVPMAYVVSHRYAKHSSAQTALLVFGFVTGGALSIISFLCRMMDIRLSGNSNGNGLMLSTLNRSYLHWIYLLFPGYALNSGVYEIAMHRVSHSSILSEADTPTVAPSFFGLFPWLGSGDCSRECWDRPGAGCCVRSVFALDVAGAPILYALLEALLFALLLFAIEKNSVKWSPDSAPPTEQEDDEEDSDVTAERRRVATIVDPTSPSGDAVVLRNVRQQYKGGKIALHDLSLGIPKGECFGYLGINGAGKSTTMKILTGQIAPSSGFASLGGYDLAHYRDQARTVVGYCPQFDSLHDLLTVEEQLELYARLKGIPLEHIGDAANQKILELGLHDYRTKLTRGLSGGNKRKVSTAIALLGAPRIIFLDEPSTGVDPSSRRKMWDVIASVCAEKDSCVVLTTHSMEECEALATRVGILVSGKLQCLGSVEHLKQKFGKGFTVEVKLRAPSDDVVAAIAARVSSVIGEQGHVTPENLQEVCTALGDVDRYELILAGDASAVVLTQLLGADKLVPLTTFCEWWAAEDMGTRLVDFFESSFAGSDVVEQQGGDHFRFQVPKQDNRLRPSTIFRKLEDDKATLAIGEYSVSDTTLEHIFNTMAAQQEEEQLGESELSKETAVGRTASTRVSTRRRHRRSTYGRASSSQPMA